MSMGKVNLLRVSRSRTLVNLSSPGRRLLVYGTSTDSEPPGTGARNGGDYTEFVNFNVVYEYTVVPRIYGQLLKLTVR